LKSFQQIINLKLKGAYWLTFDQPGSPGLSERQTCHGAGVQVMIEAQIAVIMAAKIQQRLKQRWHGHSLSIPCAEDVLG
jgi:hypothetical protein